MCSVVCVCGVVASGRPRRGGWPTTSADDAACLGLQLRVTMIVMWWVVVPCFILLGPLFSVLGEVSLGPVILSRFPVGGVGCFRVVQTLVYVLCGM